MVAQSASELRKLFFTGTAGGVTGFLFRWSWGAFLGVLGGVLAEGFFARLAWVCALAGGSAPKEKKTKGIRTERFEEGG